MEVPNNTAMNRQVIDAHNPSAGANTQCVAQRSLNNEPGRTFLVVLYPVGDLSKPIELRDGQINLGRVPASDVVLKDPSVSRRHAVVRQDGTDWFLTDLGSTNGTYVNDDLVTWHHLKNGDLIRLGIYVLKFISSEDIESQYHEAMHTMSYTDGMTSVFNKGFFLQALNNEFAQESASLSLILIDLDRFKQVNDAYGHLAGDLVLKEFARRSRKVLADECVLARYGGEEFAILCRDLPYSHVVQMCERLRRETEATPVYFANNQIDFTVSIGVAHVEDHQSTSPTELIAQADAKLYEAKQTGRNRICL